MDEDEKLVAKFGCSFCAITLALAFLAWAVVVYGAILIVRAIG